MCYPRWLTLKDVYRQLEINHHPRCTSAWHLALHTILLSALRAHTRHLPRAHLYVSIQLVKQARHAVRVDTWLCERSMRRHMAFLFVVIWNT